MSTIISTNLRYITLGLSRAFGGFYYWLTRSWRPPLFWLILTGVAIWATDNFDIIFHHKAGTWFQWWNVLAVYTLLWLLWWAWQARKRVVIEDFMDYTVSPSKSDSRGLATLLVVRLAQLQELYHAVDEQRSISTEAKSDQTIDATIKVEDVSQFLTGAISAQSKFSLGPLEIPVGTLLALIGRLVQGPRIIGSLHKDKDILTLTAQRVGGEATYSWRVDSTLPAQSVGDITSTHDAMVNELACRMFTDLALSGSVRWRATSTFSEGLRAYRDCLRTPKDKKINLKMAEKKFLETLVEDKEFNSAYYNLGVVYMELEQLEAAEEAFRRAISQTPSSWRPYYAMAVCRCKRKQYESVKSLCQRVTDRIITRKPGLANLAKVYHTKGLARSLLVEQNLSASQGQTKDLPDEIDELLKHIDDLNSAILDYKKAVSLSWRALCRAELLQQGVTETENRVIPQREATAGICLTDLAKAYSDQAELYSELAKRYMDQAEKKAVEGRKNTAKYQKIVTRRFFAYKRAKKQFERAKALFRQATFLTPSNTESYFDLYNHYTDNYFNLGKMYYEWEKYEWDKYLNATKYDESMKLDRAIKKVEPVEFDGAMKFDEAIEEYTNAVQINPEEAKYWAYLGLAYAAAAETQIITLPRTSKDNRKQARKACKKALGCLSSASLNTLVDTLETVAETYGKLEKIRDEERRNEERDINDQVKDMSSDQVEEERKSAHVKDMKNLLIDTFAIIVDKYTKLGNTTETQRIKEMKSLLADAKNQKRGHINSIEDVKHQLSRYTQEDQKWIYAQVSLSLGSLFLASNEAAQVEVFFRDAINHLEEKYPQEIRTQELRALLVYALLSQKHHDEALQEAKKALELDPLCYFEREALGDVYFTLNEFEHAIAAWEEALLRKNVSMAKLPDLSNLDTSGIHYKIGASSLPRKDVLDIHYKIGVSYIELAQHYRELSKRSAAYQKAGTYLERAHDLYEGDHQQEKRAIHFFLGFLHFELGQYEQAISYLRIAKTQKLMRLTSLFYLGWSYIKNKEYDASLKQFGTLLTEASALVAQQVPIGKLIEAESVGFMALGEILAMAHWGIAFTNAERNTNLDVALDNIGKAETYIEAMKHLNGSVKLHFPGICPDCKGWIYYEQDNIEDAIASLKQAVSQTTNPQVYLHLALAYERKLQRSIGDSVSLNEMRACCQHVRELDIRKEYEQQVNEILQRHQNKARSSRK